MVHLPVIVAIAADCLGTLTSVKYVFLWLVQFLLLDNVCWLHANTCVNYDHFCYFICRFKVMDINQKNSRNDYSAFRGKMKIPEFSDSDSDFETIAPKKRQCIDLTTPDDGSSMGSLMSRMENLEKCVKVSQPS